MEYKQLGNTGIEVSRLCFGGLVIGPLQANLSDDEGAAVIARAFEMGVNFIDTAELYGTYPHIKKAVQRSGKKPVIATKSYAYDRQGAVKSFETARKEMDIDVIDIFLLHEQESEHTLRGHREALEFYLNEKEKGNIRAVGLSTHHVRAVEAAIKCPEIQVIHPIINRTGIGIADGTIDDMLGAVKKAYDTGKGIYGMKPLGGGNLLASYDECLSFVLEIPYIHSIALGMQTEEEVYMNICTFEGAPAPDEIKKRLQKKQRRLNIDFWCSGCGKCSERCSQKAIYIEEGKAKVLRERCVLCGYCAGACEQFAIKIF